MDLFKWVTKQVPVPEHMQHNEAFKVIPDTVVPIQQARVLSSFGGFPLVMSVESFYFFFTKL